MTRGTINRTFLREYGELYNKTYENNPKAIADIRGYIKPCIYCLNDNNSSDNMQEQFPFLF